MQVLRAANLRELAAADNACVDADPGPAVECGAWVLHRRAEIQSPAKVRSIFNRKYVKHYNIELKDHETLK